MRARLSAPVLLLSALWAIVAAGGAHAESVVVALSQKKVEIRSNFVGAEIVLFGSVDRDARTVGRRSEGYDIVVVIEGPARNVVVWHKERVAGIWVNRTGIEFRNAPSYYAALSNRPLDDIAGALALRRQQIGIGNVRLSPAVEADPVEVDEYRDALVRRQVAQHLFLDDPAGVEMLTNDMFLARIPLPAYIRTGGYRARVHVFSDGALVATERLGFWVVKIDFEAAVHDLAQKEPLVYGLLTVGLAFGVGWLGSVLFRRP